MPTAQFPLSGTALIVLALAGGILSIAGIAGTRDRYLMGAADAAIVAPAAAVTLAVLAFVFARRGETVVASAFAVGAVAFAVVRVRRR